ncbi:unnamed protein product [Malus baccata var. baccata]
MQPLPVPQWKWENITIDFVYKIPRAHNGFDGVWVVVDRLTKSAHFIPVREKYPLKKLAKLFITKIVKYHGVPVNITSDRDPRFTSKFWIAFQEAPKVGERVLEGPEIVDETTQNVQVIKSNLKATQDRQKSLVDRHATDRVYDVGNLIFLKLSPWRGVVRFGKKSKLSPRYIEPYEIAERIGEVAYRLKLPPELSKINLDLTYDEEPMTILDWKDKVLRNKTVSLVKVLWRNHSAEEATWETEDRMREMYPRLFYEY